MVTTTAKESLARCTLCPALCPLGLAWIGPDIPRVEYPLAPGTGLCPRGSALGELLSSPARLRWPRRREGGRLVDLELAEGIAAAAERVSGGAVVFLDGNIPIEELAAAAEIAAAWDGVRLCPVIGPDDEQALLGVEASGAHYLADEELADCDGFVIVGDAFAANPRCARPVLDALKTKRRLSLVVIDSGGGAAASFATHLVGCGAGGELASLQSEMVAAAVGGCKKLGVILACDPGRGRGWRRMGYVAGKLANAHGGGVSVQTSGANALTAVRARQELGLMPLAEGTSSGQADTVRVALGVDVLGLLGWSGPPLAVAAAAVPNQTTESAELILPIALPCEVGGTFLQAGTRPVRSAPLLAPPAGVPTPVQLLRALAEAAGVRVASWSGRQPSLDRVALAEPAEVAGRPTNCRMITTGRQATHDDGGGLTAWASWQGQVQPLAELRVSPADAGELGLADLDEVNVETDSHCTRARIRIVTQLSPGTLTVSAGFPEARKLVPYATDAEQDVLVSDPAPVRVDK